MRGLLAGAALFGALLAASPAAAQLTAIDELRPLRPGMAVSIEVTTHTLVVEGWDRNEVQITGEYDPSVEELRIDERRETFRFEIEAEGRRGRGDRFGRGRGTDAPLQVRVPRGARVDLETVSGNVTVTGFAGALEASAVSGRVEVTGNLESVELNAVSGRVRYAGNAPVVRLESVSGNVDFTGTARDLRLEAVSGSVVMDGGAESIDAESVSGSVRLVSSVPVRVLDASSVSGSVDFRGGLASGARVEVESHSGQVELLIVGATNAEFDLESFSGNLDVQLAGMRDVISNRSRTPARSLRFATGDGAGRVAVSSFSGNVRISAAR